LSTSISRLKRVFSIHLFSIRHILLEKMYIDICNDSPEVLMTTKKSIDSYRLTDPEDPTDEMLAQIMKEAAEEARMANADATKRFFSEIENAIAAIR